MQNALVKRAFRLSTASPCVAKGVCRVPRASCVRPSAAFREKVTPDADGASTSGSSYSPLAAAGPAFAASVALLLLSEGPALADAGASPFQGVTANR
jgi:hypothetical protein